MKSTELIKNILCYCVMSFISFNAFSAHAQVLNCPSTAEIGQLTYGAALPYGFDKKTLRAKFVVGALETERNNLNENGEWILLMYPVAARQSENIQTLSQSYIERLVKVTPTPYQFNIVDDIQLTFCAYAVPGQDDVTAMAYFIDNNYDDDEYDDDFSAKIKSKVSHSRQRMMKLIQHTKQMFLK